ncbi:MAG: type III-B CRISPR module RAMP protein Cmr4 [Acidobacteriota bacterium]|jgi:CRISPR-associated protein Cmr4
MFEQSQLVFFHCVSPVHVGAGQAIGAIDNPIQRERHTGHPCFAASGLKGALRDHFLEVTRARFGKEEGPPEEDPRKRAEALTDRLFGPLPRSNEEITHAGCVAFTDAQLLLLPVRSPRHAFAWITCPTAWERFRRAALLASGAGQAARTPGEPPPEGKGSPALPPAFPASDANGAAPTGMACWVASADEWPEEQVILDTLLLTHSGNNDLAGKIARWLQGNAFPAAFGFSNFSQKLARHLVVVSDLVFSHFVTHATLVEPHVKIDDVTGTVEEKLFFYTENLPPESVLYSLAMVGKERTKDGRAAAAVLEDLRALDGQLVQIGGDATTGRGLVVLHFATDGRPAGGR